MKKFQDFIDFTLRGSEEAVAAQMCRLVFHELIPENVDKLLFIDTDAAVLEDLSGCFDIKVGGRLYIST